MTEKWFNDASISGIDGTDGYIAEGAMIFQDWIKSGKPTGGREYFKFVNSIRRKLFLPEYSWEEYLK